MHPRTLLPPVDRRLVPYLLEPARHVLRRVVPPRRPAPADRAEEEPPPVDLALRPLGLVALSVQRVARLERTVGRPRDESRAPVEEAVAALHLPRLAHGVRVEAAVAEPLL